MKYYRLATDIFYKVNNRFYYLLPAYQPELFSLGGLEPIDLQHPIDVHTYGDEIYYFLPDAEWSIYSENWNDAHINDCEYLETITLEQLVERKAILSL